MLEVILYVFVLFFFFSSRRRHTRCALVTGVQTCALPIWTVQNRLQNRLFGILGVLDSLVLPVLCRSWKVVAQAFNQTEKFDDALLGEAASQLQAARKSVV